MRIPRSSRNIFFWGRGKYLGVQCGRSRWFSSDDIQYDTEIEITYVGMLDRSSEILPSSFHLSRTTVHKDLCTNCINQLWSEMSHQRKSSMSLPFLIFLISTPHAAYRMLQEFAISTKVSQYRLHKFIIYTRVCLMHTYANLLVLLKSWWHFNINFWWNLAHL